MFHSIITDREKVFSKKLCLTLELGILFAFFVEYGLVNLGIILKSYLKIGLSKFYESSIIFCTIICAAETRSQTPQRVSF